MDINELYKVLIAVLASVGGAGVIMLKLSSYLGRVWAERLAGEQRFKFEKELEELKAEFQLNNDLNKEEYLSRLRRKEEEFKKELDNERENHKFEIWKREQELLVEIDSQKEKNKEVWVFKKQLSAKMRHFNHGIKHAVEEGGEGYKSSLSRIHKEIRHFARVHAYFFGADSDELIERMNRYTDLAILAGSNKFDFNKYDTARVEVGRLIEKWCE